MFRKGEHAHYLLCPTLVSHLAISLGGYIILVTIHSNFSQFWTEDVQKLKLISDYYQASQTIFQPNF